jgi:alkylated DNA repair dioxygenase AlkB
MKMQTPYFTYKSKLVPEKYFDILYEEVKDKVEKNSSRKSCVYNLHNINLDVGYSVPSYNYSEVPSSLGEIRTLVEKDTNEIYDYVLVHIYEDGNSMITWHNDKEALNSTICSISLGAARKFRLKEKERKTGWDYEFYLSSGDMILMHKPSDLNDFIGCQNKYLHTIPVESKVKNRRINLTFRQYEI